ncbi:MAG TPA: hypothetical protein VM163_05930 [bacterium]|nr:hypothetical protein [bacterium]
MRAHLTSRALLAVVVFWSVAVWPTRAGDPEVESPVVTPANAETEMITALEQVVGVRERQLASLELLAQAGRASADTVDGATVDLWRARNRLAEARRQPDAVIEGLRKILAIKEETHRRLLLRSEAGRIGPSDLEVARLQALDARVDLCRAVMQTSRTP